MVIEDAGRPDRIQFRPAGAHDAGAIARLHADSWRRHYRGAYSDAFLDGDVEEDRRAVWVDRLREPRPNIRTIVAADAGAVVGFAHTILDEDPTWGALLDNLHVAHTHRRQGLGSRLLAMTARAVIERRSSSGLYLWVLEQNEPAQTFYRAGGGRCVERSSVEAPGGDASRLNGSPAKLRYAWPDPARLLAAD
jgi:ribosomal protein S18 acetylase RimI-like enzyme